MFIASLCIITKSQKQLRCHPSTDRKSNHGRFIQQNAIQQGRGTTWMNFKYILLSERSPTQNAYVISFHLYDMINDQIIRVKNQCQGYKVIGRVFLKKRQHEGVLRVMKLFRIITIIVDKWHYTFSRPIDLFICQKMSIYILKNQPGCGGKLKMK